MKIIIFGLSITSSWGNGHATTFRSLASELSSRGHDITFFERDVPWYARNRDLVNPTFCKTILYSGLHELYEYRQAVRDADFVMTGSYVPDGIALIDWVLKTAGGITAFYDIDTPVTLGRLATDRIDYLSPKQIPDFDLYLSFTGGPILQKIERQYKARRAVALYCSVDPSLYFPECRPAQWDFGYMGTYSADRQPPLNRLLVRTARSWEQGRFIVAGPLYPQTLDWPANVERVEHIQPDKHREFYTSQRFTLNITRSDMVSAGYSPSVRLFEAAACATPIISDYWDGLDSFFTIGSEILISRSPEETLRFLRDFPEDECRHIGELSRERVLRQHTASHRARELEYAVSEALNAH